MEAFADALRREMRPFQVLVSVIEPGTTRTPILNDNLLADRLKQMWDNLSAETQREYGKEYLENGEHEVSVTVAETVVLIINSQARSSGAREKLSQGSLSITLTSRRSQETKEEKPALRLADSETMIYGLLALCDVS